MASIPNVFEAYDVKSDYAFGRSEAETRRLIIQSAVLRPFTERLMKAVGLNRGMHVLDLGCGTGDVSILAAKIVGESGEVIGIDHDGSSRSIVPQHVSADGEAWNKWV